MEIKGADILRLVTRFQYKGEHMMFEILLRLNESGKLLPYIVTEDYGEFRKTFNQLMDVRRNNGNLTVNTSAGSQAA